MRKRNLQGQNVEALAHLRSRSCIIGGCGANKDGRPSFDRTPNEGGRGGTSGESMCHVPVDNGNTAWIGLFRMTAGTLDRDTTQERDNGSG